MELKTIKVVNPQEEGGHMIINESDFDPEKHEVFGAAALVTKLSISELREALTAKGIDFPEGAKKAELQALLDASE